MEGVKRTIYMGRHAKSSWDFPELRDHDRPLNERGIRDAPFMARMMERLERSPDLIITSTAKRAHDTALAYKEVFFVPDKHFWTDRRIYDAAMEDIENVIQEVSEFFECIYVFGHNPTMHNIANIYTMLSKFSTAGILGLEWPGDDWGNFHFNGCTYKNFHAPKLLQK